MKLGEPKPEYFLEDMERVGFELLGKTINRIGLDAGKQFIEFETNSGNIYAGADGDCCSNSWINNITGLDNLLNEQVIEFRTKEEGLIAKPNTTENDEMEMKYYALTLITKKGYFDVEFRNSSNGYYGGSLDLIVKIPSGMLIFEVDKDF